MASNVLLALLAASLGWGLAGVGVRAAFMEGASTFTVVVIRTAVATLVVVGFAMARHRGISARAWRDGALIGIPRVGLAPILFIASLNHVSAGFEGIVITLVPVVTATMAHFALKERLAGRQILGLALGLGGTTFMVLSGDTGIAGGEGSTFVGGALALGGVLFGSISGVVSRRFAPEHSTGTLSVPMFVSGLVVAAVASLAVSDFEPGGLNAMTWVILVLLGLGSTLLPFVATLYASARTTAAKVAFTGYVAPIVGVIGGAVLLDEVITLSIALGGFLALSGVILAGSVPQPVPDLVE